MPTNGNLWTEEECARFLQVSPHTIKKWKQAGRIPYVKMNRAVRFVPEDVRNFVLENRIEARCQHCGEPHERASLSLPSEPQSDFPRYQCDVA